MQAFGEARLRQEHCAELAGADQADGDGLSGGFTLKQQGAEIHVITSDVITRAGG
jgi:hypothetical protein